MIYLKGNRHCNLLSLIEVSELLKSACMFIFLTLLNFIIFWYLIQSS